MKAIVAVFIVMLSVLSYEAYADWMPLYEVFGESGIATPVENDSIKMVSAIIDIEHVYAAETQKFRCRFVFKNLTNKIQHVTMGFPIKYDDDSRYKVNYINDFTITENGKTKVWPNPGKDDFYDSREEITVVNGFKVTENGKNKAWRNDFKSEGFDDVYAVETQFAPGEEKRIENTYLYTYNHNEIDYILKTGALWAGPIDTLKITLHFTDIQNELFSFGSSISQFTQLPIDDAYPNEVTLVYEKLACEPDTNMSVSYGRKIPLSILKNYVEKKKFTRLEELLDVIREPATYEYDFSLSDSGTKHGFKYILYWTANEYFRTNMEKAIGYYLWAFRCVEENMFGSDPVNLEQKDISEWKRESENEAPAYYIAYNLACAYSIIDNYQSSSWLRIAIRLNPTLIKTMMKTDKDLANLRNTPVYKDIAKTEPKKIISLKQITLDKVKAFYNDYVKANPVTDKSPVKKNSINFVYIPQDHAPYAVVVYYESIGNNTISVKFGMGGPHGDINFAEAECNITTGRGIKIIPLELSNKYGELQEDWIQDCKVTAVMFQEGKKYKFNGTECYANSEEYLKNAQE